MLVIEIRADTDFVPQDLIQRTIAVHAGKPGDEAARQHPVDRLARGGRGEPGQGEDLVVTDLARI